MRDALKGILVVSLGQAVAAPYATMRLADGGARVIKVERPGGDFGRYYDTVANGECSFFVWLNRGAESLELDLKQPDDVALLRRILGEADIFIQNLAPGALDRMGLGSAQLRSEFRKLITCDISGYGAAGPYQNMKAYDLLIQAESGVASLTGSPGEAGRIGVSACDLTAGMNAHAAILEALIARGRTGEGQGIHVSLFDGMADWMNTPLMHQRYAGKAPGRTGLAHPQVVPYGLFRARDGEIVIAIQNNREWARFCDGVLQQAELVEHADYVTNEVRAQNRDALNEIIAECFAGLDRDTLSTRLERADIAFGRLNSVADLMAHPQLRELVQPTPSGDVILAAPAAQFTALASPPRPIPALGEHSQAIRAEFSDGK